MLLAIPGSDGDAFVKLRGGDGLELGELLAFNKIGVCQLRVHRDGALHVLHPPRILHVVGGRGIVAVLRQQLLLVCKLWQLLLVQLPPSICAIVGVIPVGLVCHAACPIAHQQL